MQYLLFCSHQSDTYQEAVLIDNQTFFFQFFGNTLHGIGSLYLKSNLLARCLLNGYRPKDLIAKLISLFAQLFPFF